ncbi:MAG: hypothetical protein HRT88_18900, partial [Lentisphaeraceae bacterium]|nr:hypothetical protein [Lentisphaeraceae bacterium]
MNKALLTLSALALAVGCQSTPKMKAPVDHYNSCDFDKRISVDDGIEQDVPQEAIALAWQVYRQGNCDRAIAIM